MKWFIALLTCVFAFVCWRDDATMAPIDPLVLMKRMRGSLIVTGTDPLRESITIETSPDDVPVEIVLLPGIYSVVFLPIEREDADVIDRAYPSAVYERTVRVSLGKKTAISPLVLTPPWEEPPAKGVAGPCGGGPNPPMCRASQICAIVDDKAPNCYRVCDESTPCRTGVCTPVATGNLIGAQGIPLSRLLHICLRTVI